MRNTRVFILIALLLFAGAIGFVAFKHSGEKRAIDVFNWPYYLDQEIIAKFEKECDCRVNYKEFPSNEDLLNDIENSTTKWDVIFPSDHMVEKMANRKLLSPIDKSKLSNYQNLNQQFLFKNYDKNNEYSIPFSWGCTGIGFNKSSVSDPSSYKIFFQPRNKGRMGLLDDVRFTIGMALLYKGYSINTKDPKQLKEVEKLLSDQKQYVKSYNSENYVDLLKSGEVDMFYGYSGDVIQSIPENPNLDFVIPNEGGILYIDNMCIPRKADNTDLAYQFINFLLDKETAASIINKKWFAIPNKAAEPLVDARIKNNPSVYPPDSTIAKCQMLLDLGEDVKLYEEIWKKVKQ